MKDYEKLSYLFAGKLLLREEISLEDNYLQVLLHKKLFQRTQSFTRRSFSIICNRCGNEQKALLGKIDCQKCNKAHYYCRKCIEMGRVMECEPLYIWTGCEPNWPISDNPCTWSGTLRNVQLIAANRIKRAIIQREKEILSWAVCGSGKTEMIFPAITKAIKLGKRICIATPRADVVRELLPRMRQAFSATSIQGLYSGSKDKSGTAQIIITTTHQLIRYKHAFDIVVVDEIDAFPYHADPTLPYVTKRAAKKQGTMIYLTATPRKQLQRRINKNELPHIFVPNRFHGYPLPVPKMKLSLSLKRKMKHKSLPYSIIQWLKTRKNKERQLLIFVPTIQFAKEVSNLLQDLLIKEKIIRESDRVVSVYAEDLNREEKIDKFREGDIYILVTTTILERGVTFPSVDVAIIDSSHEVFDEAALVQIAGRAGRSPKDPFGEVIFFHNGKTEAMVRAVKQIQKMNERGGFT